MDFVVLSGLYTAAGPVLGVQLVDGGNGVPLVLDLAEKCARVVNEDEEIFDPATADRPLTPTTVYAVASKRTGQPGRQTYASAVMAALALTARPDRADYMLAALKENDGQMQVDALSPDELQHVNNFLKSVGLPERVV